MMGTGGEGDLVGGRKRSCGSRCVKPETLPNIKNKQDQVHGYLSRVGVGEIKSKGSEMGKKIKTWKRRKNKVR